MNVSIYALKAPEPLVVALNWSSPPHQFSWNLVSVPENDFAIDSMIDTQKQYLLKKNKAFCGAFRIALCKLNQKDVEVNPRQLNRKNVQRLINIFALEGCFRLEPDNYVTALLPHSLLIRVPRICTVPANGDVVPSVFDSPEPLQCIHGKHRIETAKKYFALKSKWWVINVYVKKYLSFSTLKVIRNESQNDKSFFDDEIYRHIRMCQQVSDPRDKKSWLSRLSDVKRRDVLQLEKRAEKCIKIKDFERSLNSLILYRGLWPALQLETFHRLLALRCSEIPLLIL